MKACRWRRAMWQAASRLDRDVASRADAASGRAARPLGQHHRMVGSKRCPRRFCRPAPRFGVALARLLPQAVNQSLAQRPADVLILGNHGLVVGATTCDEAQVVVVEVEQRLALTPRNASRADDSALVQSCAGTKYRPAQDALCHQLATDPYNLAISTRGSLYLGPCDFFRPRAASTRPRRGFGYARSPSRGGGLAPTGGCANSGQRYGYLHQCKPRGREHC